MKKKLVSALMILGLMTFATGCGSSGNAADKVERDYDITQCVTLGEYQGIEKEVVLAQKADIEAAIQEDLEAAGVPEQLTEGIVADGDTVNIDYVGKKDGVAFDGGTAQGYDLVIGSGSFIDGFEDGLIGVGVGDTVDLDLTFPESYHSTDLAGQAVVFTVTVNYIHGDVIAPDIEAYALDNSYESVDAYRTEVEEELNASNAEEAEENVWLTVVDNATINEYPQSEIDTALASMKNYYTQLAEAWGTDLDGLLSQVGSSEDTFEEDMLEYAQMAVAEKLVAFAIAEAENITVSEEEYDARIEEYLEMYDAYETKEEIEAVIDPDNLKDQLLMEKAQQFVYDCAVEK